MIDLISRFQETQVIGWVNIHNINRVDVNLNGKPSETDKLFEVLSQQLQVIGCKVNSQFIEDYKMMIINEFRR